MASIILTTINARFIHASLGLRYLHANLGDLRDQATLIEFENSQSAKEIVEVIVAHAPKLVGFGVYIWNVSRTREVVSLLKRLNPEIVIVIGGPEVSYEYEETPLFQLSDYLITGEADKAFSELAAQVVAGHPPQQKVIQGGLPALAELELPYSLYSDKDVAHRVIYVEVSRGCPFTCEFCLSSVDIPVRQFDHIKVLAEIDALYKRGARSFKFIDRTFNLNIRVATDILRFFLDRMEPGLFVHFEMVPDRFPDKLRDVVSQFPPGALQLEIGVQTLNPHVGELIRRRQNVDALFDNLSYLRNHTAAYLHVDLIVGLPGEDLASFGAGFDRLVAIDPHEIQVGVLKRLRGTPIARHSEAFSMRFSEDPPYEVISTQDVSFAEMRRMERFSRYWDVVANSGNFRDSRALLWRDGDSPWRLFMEFSDWLYARVGRSSSIELKALTDHVFEFLTHVRKLDPQEVGQCLAADYQRGGRNDLPVSLRPFSVSSREQVVPRGGAAKRQQRVIGT